MGATAGPHPVAESKTEEGFLFLTVMTSRVVCLALLCPQWRKRKAWGGRIAKQLVRDGVMDKWLAGKNSRHSVNPYWCHFECLSHVFTFTQQPFWSVCWPDASPCDLFGKRLAQKRLWKWITCLYKYRFCIIQSFLSEKEVKSSVRGFFFAIDLLKHLVEEAEAFEGDRMWVLCEMRCVCVCVVLCWRQGNMWALWCAEIVHRCDLRILETDGGWGGLGGISLNWNDRLVEASLTQEAQPWIWAEYSWLFQQAQLFIYSFLQISLE